MKLENAEAYAPQVSDDMHDRHLPFLVLLFWDMCTYHLVMYDKRPI